MASDSKADEKKIEYKNGNKRGKAKREEEERKRDGESFDVKGFGMDM